jgi:CRISPR-associated protein Cas1
MERRYKMKVVNKVLYILDDKTFLNIDCDTIVIRQEEKEKVRIPIKLIEQIIIFGNTTITSPMLKECNENNISISYVSIYGNFYGRFYEKTNGNIILRKKQYEMYETEKALNLVRNIILGKIINSRNVLLRISRDMTDLDKKDKIIKSCNKIESQISILKISSSIENIRGIEAVVAQIYFQTIDICLKNIEDDMFFEKRTKRPPENNFNALLSLLYTMLSLNVSSALESFGLDSALGYMHLIHPGRASLALDLMEEFRAPIVDKFVITLVNRKQITSNDFEKKEQGICLKEKSLKKVLKLWEEHKEEEILHPLYNEKIKIKNIPYIQAQLIAQYIREDIKEYPPFKWK